MISACREEGTRGIPCMIHASKLVSPDSPHAPEMLWEWEQLHIGRLLWNATTFGRELMQQYFPD